MNTKILIGAAVLSVIVAPGALWAEGQTSTVASAMEKTGDYASDSALTAKVKAAFLAEKHLKSLDISVETTSGVVTLFGRVDSSAQSERAEAVARHVEGVKDVHNTLALKTAD